MKAEGAELIIAMPHAGFEDMPETPYMENTVLPLSRVGGIDAILFVHAYQVFPGPLFAVKRGLMPIAAPSMIFRR